MFDFFFFNLKRKSGWEDSALFLLLFNWFLNFPREVSMDIAYSFQGPSSSTPSILILYWKVWDNHIWCLSILSSIFQDLSACHMIFLLSLSFVESVPCVRCSSLCLEYASERNTQMSLPSLCLQSNLHLYSLSYFCS